MSRPIASSIAARLAARFRWVTATPRGRRVEPLVYCRTARSPGYGRTGVTGLARAVSVIKSRRRQAAALAEEQGVRPEFFARGERGFDGGNDEDLARAGFEEHRGGGAGAQGIDDDGGAVLFARIGASGFAFDEVPGCQ